MAFVERELTDPQGGFYCAVDAETAGQEGIYYAWLPGEIKAALTPDEFALASLAFGLDDKPNFEERYVLVRETSDDELAKVRKQSVAQLLPQLRAVEDKLLAVRQSAPRPLTDTKMLAGWNGLMIRGYAEAGRVWKNPRLPGRGRQSGRFSARQPAHQGRAVAAKLPRRAGQGAGVSRRLRLTIAGLLALHRADGNRRWLDAAAELQRDQLARFWDQRGGGFFFTSAEHEVLFARSKMAVDGVMPSGSSVSAANLIALGRALPKPEYLLRARETIAVVAPLLKDSPSAAPQMAVAVAELLSEPAAKDAPQNP